jgi:hypothetical protein
MSWIVEAPNNNPSVFVLISSTVFQIDGSCASSLQGSHVIARLAVRDDVGICRGVEAVGDVVEAVVEQVAVLVERHRRRLVSDMRVIQAVID